MLFRSSTEDIHVLATQLEERRGVLENLFEGMGLPIVGVVRKLNLALNIWEMSMDCIAEGLVCVRTQINVLEKREVKCRPNGVRLSGRENYMSPIVTCLDGTQDVCRIVLAVAVRLYSASFCSGSGRRERFAWMEWLDGMLGSLTSCRDKGVCFEW